ncbi:GNAT family N-acetyltransferase [uncultured Maricaulis sp.]|uniref:GNAT family N-acetyltransferase n=1 Tax=uncultured Maricaulis sp. TaxID=174710 RepID=UPI00261FF615|nr:GNAT family N-acetyltransferase [uncultured Maricaulis sp.]
MSIAVRAAGPADLDRIDSIEGASFTTDRFARRNLARMLRGGCTQFLLGDTDARAGGYLALSLRKGSRVARIYSLAVAPDSRRRGVAEALIEAAKRLATAQGRDCLRLEVRAGNRAAINLYERLGFRLHDRRNAYYEDGETALVLQAPTGPHAEPDNAEHDPL